MVTFALSSSHDHTGRTCFRLRGFTLIEVLATLAVILILAGLTLGLAGLVSAKRAETRARADLEALALALENYRAQARDYPWVQSPAAVGGVPQPEPASALLRALLGFRPTDPGRPALLVRGHFLQEELLAYEGGSFVPGSGVDPGAAFPVDPWGNPYLYIYNPSYPRSESDWVRPGFILLSAGPDGEVFLPQETFGTGLLDLEAYGNHPANRDNIEWNW